MNTQSYRCEYDLRREREREKKELIFLTDGKRKTELSFFCSLAFIVLEKKLIYLKENFSPYIRSKFYSSIFPQRQKNRPEKHTRSIHLFQNACLTDEEIRKTHTHSNLFKRRRVRLEWLHLDLIIHVTYKIVFPEQVRRKWKAFSFAKKSTLTYFFNDRFTR